MSEIMLPSGVKQSFNSNLPCQVYACRIKQASRHTPSDPKKAANLNVRLQCEIMAPDVVPDPVTGQPTKAAGRQFGIYVPATTAMINYENAFEVLGKLQLLNEAGGFAIDALIAACNRGDVWFDCLIIVEATFFETKDAKGNTVDVVVNGEPLLKGYSIKLPEAQQIVGRIAPPPGWTPPPF